ncbi:hypothetical protein R3P38DRAFT_3294259 [Favolaschia claudopus]|uniref:Uncharacterized protein n=1 Tax=Favolaschia claudopus TaxID=2862362 RepID=A0AAV9ZF40_9AGAR
MRSLRCAQLHVHRTPAQAISIHLPESQHQARNIHPVVRRTRDYRQMSIDIEYLALPPSEIGRSCVEEMIIEALINGECGGASSWHFSAADEIAEVDEKEEAEEGEEKAGGEESELEDQFAWHYGASPLPAPTLSIPLPRPHYLSSHLNRPAAGSPNDGGVVIAPSPSTHPVFPAFAFTASIVKLHSPRPHSFLLPSTTVTRTTTPPPPSPSPSLAPPAPSPSVPPPSSPSSSIPSPPPTASASAPAHSFVQSSSSSSRRYSPYSPPRTTWHPARRAGGARLPNRLGLQQGCERGKARVCIWAGGLRDTAVGAESTGDAGKTGLGPSSPPPTDLLPRLLPFSSSTIPPAPASSPSPVPHKLFTPAAASASVLASSARSTRHSPFSPSPLASHLHLKSRVLSRWALWSGVVCGSASCVGDDGIGGGTLSGREDKDEEEGE